MIGFTIGLRGLLASSRTMDVVGQNISNFGTEGYSRKTAALTTTYPLAYPGIGVFGTGVQLADVRRVHDDLLEARLQSQTQSLGHSEARRSMLQFLDGIFRELGDDGVSARLDGFFNDASALSGFPSDPSLRSSLVSSADSLALSFRQTSSRLADLAHDSTQTARTAVDTVNGLLRQIATVNEQVLQGSQGQEEASDLLDAQDRLVGELSQWVDVDAIRRERGGIDVLLDGRLLVSGKSAKQLEMDVPSNAAPKLRVAGTKDSVEIRKGRLQGFLDVATQTVPARQAEVDRIARALILEANRVHSTGVPDSGSYHELLSEVAVGWTTSKGAEARYSPLAALGLDFPVQDGKLVVNVIDEATGALDQTVLEIDPAKTTLEDLRRALDGIDHLSASLDGAGRMRIQSARGFAFDFSRRVDSDPDPIGTFGSDRATLSGLEGPYSLTVGDSFTVDVDGTGPQAITIQAGDFADPSNATPEELAAVLARDLSGATASVVDGRLVLQSDSSGPSGSLLVSDLLGTPSAALGLSNTLEVGSDVAAGIQLEGVSTSGLEGTFHVRPISDGTIGLTDGLTVEILDEKGSVVSRVDLGSGYEPGTKIEIVPGVFLTAQAGQVSATAGDSFQFDLHQDGDTSDVLVALGIGTLFKGSDAGSMELVDRVRDDPRKLATSDSGVPGDGSNLGKLLDLRDRPLTDLDLLDVNAAWNKTVTTVGLDVQASQSQEEADRLVLDSLRARRDEISGVNVDEEMLKLVEMQQLYAASARYLTAVNEMTQILFSIV